MSSKCGIRRPLLAAHARYRWDGVRGQHQLVYAEGVLVLNSTAAAIVQLCDGRSCESLVATLEQEVDNNDVKQDVNEFLRRLADKGLLRDADDA